MFPARLESRKPQERGDCPVMRVTIERSAFLKALTHVQSVVERRNTIPILSNVLLQAGDGQLKLTATDLDIEIVESVPAEVGKDRKVLEINVDVPEDEIKAAVSQEIAEYIVKSGLEVNEKTMKHLQDLSVQWYKLKNENLIYGKIAEAARLMTDEEWKKRTGISGGKDKPIDGGGSEQTDEQKAIERIKSGK